MSPPPTYPRPVPPPGSTNPSSTPDPRVRVTPPEWARLHVWQIQPVRDLLIIALLLGIVWLGYRLSIVTVPMLLALLLAYLFEPLIAWLTRHGRMRRPFAVLMLIVVSALVVVVPTTLGLTFGLAQGSDFAKAQVGNIDRLIRSVDKPDDNTLRDALPSERWKSLRDWLVEQEAKAALTSAVQGARRGVTTKPEPPSASDPTKPTDQVLPEENPALTTPPLEVQSAVPSTLAHDNQSPPFEFISTGVAQVTASAVAWLRENAGGLGARAVQAGAGALNTVGRVAGSIAAILFAAFLTMFFFYFFSTSWDHVLTNFKDIVPERKRTRVFSLAQRMDRVIAGFIRGRLTICACQIVFFTIAYWIIGVPAPLVVGPLVGLLTLIPYGAALGMPVAMLLMALDPSISSGVRATWWWIIATPIVVQCISQVMDDYFLTPKIQGKNTDMSMPMILFASIAGGVLAGVYGLLIAIPVAACAKILFLEVLMPRIKAWVAGKAEDVLPIER